MSAATGAGGRPRLAHALGHAGGAVVVWELVAGVWLPERQARAGDAVAAAERDCEGGGEMIGSGDC